MKLNVDKKDENTSMRTKISGEHNRRSTILLPHDESDESNKKSTVVLFQDRQIDEKSKVKGNEKGDITVGGAIYLTKVAVEFNANQPEGHDKRLVLFLTTEVQKSLIRSDQLLRIPHANLLNVKNILRINDADVKLMISRIRPKGLEAYKDGMLTCVKVKFPGIRKSSEFSLRNYHGVFHAAINEALDIAVEVDGFFRDGATPTELGLMPTHGWGKELLPGVNRIIMEAVADQFVASFTGLLGLEAIMRCQTVEQFVALFKEANNEAAIDSQKQSQKEERVKVPKKLSVMKEDIEQKRILARANRDNPKVSFELEHKEHMAKQSLQTIAYGKRERLEEEGLAIDEAIRRAATLNIVQGPLNLQSRRSERFPDQISQAKPSTGTKKLACFDFAFLNQCMIGADKCKYSHDKQVVREFLREQNMKVLNSPHWGQKQECLAVLVHNSPHFDTSLNQLSTTRERFGETEHVLGSIYQEQMEAEDAMYLDEHERLLHHYVMG